MNKNAQQWVAALRSGDYQQGRTRLCSIQDGERFYCCLGVACDLYQREVGGLEEHIIKFPGREVVSYGVGAFVAMPEKVRKWVGLTDPSGHIGRPPGRHMERDSLAGLNDSGESFASIADVIESEPGGLFRACS